MTPILTRKESSKGGKILSIVVLFVVLMSGCATNRSPDPAGPNSGEPTYPILLVDNDGDRREASLAAWSGFTRVHGVLDAPVPELQPVTATLRSIPTSLQTPLSLPRVGEPGPMSEEELREALRRFISAAGPLLCGEPQQLSLIKWIDGVDGVKQAMYQQRPFRYALRGGYGELRISFTAGGRIAGLKSTCIPETERIRRGFVGLSQQRLPVDKLIESLSGRVVTYVDKDGQQQTYTISAKDTLNARELVIYPIQLAGEPAILEIHVAWEINIASAQNLTIFVDSIMGNVLGAEL